MNKAEKIKKSIMVSAKLIVFLWLYKKSASRCIPHVAQLVEGTWEPSGNIKAFPYHTFNRILEVRCVLSGRTYRRALPVSDN